MTNTRNLCTTSLLTPKGDQIIMTPFIPSHALFLLLTLTISHLTNAADPATINGSFFTFTGMRYLLTSPLPKTLTVDKATVAEFPALKGQSVSYSVLTFPPYSINPLHTHPLSAELLFLIDGYLEVGFVDTANKLFTQNLQAGDMFVFPKGLVHYQYCNSKYPATAVSAFGSADAGTVSVPGSVFTTGVDDGILAMSFKTDVAAIRKIKHGLTAHKKGK